MMFERCVQQLCGVHGAGCKDSHACDACLLSTIMKQLLLLLLLSNACQSHTCAALHPCGPAAVEHNQHSLQLSGAAPSSTGTQCTHVSSTRTNHMFGNHSVNACRSPWSALWISLTLALWICAA